MFAFARAVLPAFPWPSLAAFAPQRALARLAAYDALWRERVTMRSLDDHILRDIGVSRADIDAALSRPEGVALLRRVDEFED